MKNHRHTKIVATVGPASDSEEVLNQLMEAGADVFRLNFSHGDHQNKREVIQRIRRLSKKRQRAVAILGDLQGPKIRTGIMAGGTMLLETGTEVTITTRKIEGAGLVIPTSYQKLPNDVTPGDRILLDDGLLELEVLSRANDEVSCRVIVGGQLKDRKGINLPGVKVSAPSLTAKDIEDLAFCIEEEVDYVALSFVRSADDVIDLKNRLSKSKENIRIISKIENMVEKNR